jgi:hypothetical protein
MTPMESTHVWVCKDDGSDIIRADAIVHVGMDYNGSVTARLAGGEGAAVTLVTPGTQDRPHPPDDFHRQLIRVVTQLSDAAQAFMVRPVCDESQGWRWITEPL